MEGHYIRGYGDRSRQAEIRPMPGAVEEAEKYLEGYPEAQSHLARVRRLIEGFETPYGMELLSSVRWVALEEPRIAFDPEAAVREVHSWSHRKRERFRPDHIRKAWQRLNDEGWLAMQ